MSKDDGVRLTVNISPGNWSGIEEVMRRDGVSVTEAIHRVLWYGNTLYNAIACEGQQVFIEFGDRRVQLFLIGHEN
ncbi:hypothetical protein AB0A63_13920 [Lentzea sp. NPDC042327]|uniref:hypothetical protein n=1 Tax=Lentzea sp. NPDC042327 TaxID=3154801 RepID=UPI0033E61CAF